MEHTHTERGVNMREILFRGKRTDNKQWIEGFYVLIGEENPDAYILKDNVHMVRVAHKSICEYTGLTDTNGTKIFEGDIVEVGNEVYFCRWADYNYEFEFTNDKEDFGIAYARGVEVIGNIHDNPELLKDGD